MSGLNPLREQLVDVSKRLNGLAHTIAGAGYSYEEYLINVGQYRELKRHRDALVTKLKKQETEDELPEPEEPPPPAQTLDARARRNNPRPWGGSR